MIAEEVRRLPFSFFNFISSKTLIHILLAIEEYDEKRKDHRRQRNGIKEDSKEKTGENKQQKEIDSRSRKAAE